MRYIFNISRASLLCCIALSAALSPLSTEAARSESEIDSLVNSLLSRMTLEEKVGQLNQYSFYAVDDASRAQSRQGLVGSWLNITDPSQCNALQREAVENSRLHIPLIFARDVIHGFRTIFPIPLGQAAAWNPEMVEKGARIAAEEASSAGIRWTFSPMVDIARDPRWGRVAEGFGEDPLLTSRLGAAMVRGYQGSDLSAPNTMAACVKHFAGYGAVEGGRDYNTTWLPEPLMRDVYLPPYKAGIDAGAATVMCSFNDLNGIPPSGNEWLLRNVLRDEWGYTGAVVSDWGSINEMIAHGYAADRHHAAALAANAGVDMDMEGHCYDSSLLCEVQKGDVSEETLDALVANVLRLKYRLGLFDNPYVDESAAPVAYLPESLEAAQHAVEESAVLLKNTGILPVDMSSVKKIAVIGPMADAPHDQAGTWVFDLEKSHSVTPLEALRNVASEKIIYSPGLAFSRDRSTDGFKDAVKAAKKADVVFLFAGEEAVLSGEAHCLTDITLPGAQSALIAEIKKSGTPLVLVVQAGRPLVLGKDAELADAVLYLFHGGTMTGPGVVNLLTGKVNPSGHLPMSFPRTSGQIPVYYNHKNTGRPATKITYVDDIPLEAGQTSTGCESFYLDAGVDPAYPFGYGLSYTDFAFSAPRISSTSVPVDGSLTVECDVTNTGSREGQQVVQLYIRDLVGSMTRPVRELKDFRKISLLPGETRTVSFTLPVSALSFTGRDMRPTVEPGEFQLWVSPDSATGDPVSFFVTEK